MIRNANEERAALLAAQEVTYGLRECNNGYRVKIKDSVYAASNHYIRESQPLFENKRLRVYFYFQRMRWLLVLLFVINLFCFDSFYLALGMDCINFIFLLIFLQHLQVNCCTMRYVLQQPVVDNQLERNKILELSKRELTGLVAINHQRKVGVIAANEQKVRFQVFNRVAEMLMKHAKCYSYICFLVVVCMGAYSGYFTWKKWGQWETKDQFVILKKL